MFSKVHGFPWKFNSEFGPPEKLPNTQKERKGSSSNHHFSGAKMLNFGGVTNKRRIPPWNCWFETVWKKVKQQVLDIQKTHFKNSLCCTLFKSHLPKTFSLNFRKTFSCIYCTYIYIFHNHSTQVEVDFWTLYAKMTFFLSTSLQVSNETTLVG